MTTEDFVDIEDLESRIGELELMHEDLEQDFHLLACGFISLVVHMESHNWFVTIPIAILSYFIIRKFAAKKLFTSGIRNLDSDITS